jgi:hypothetical protein
MILSSGCILFVNVSETHRNAVKLLNVKIVAGRGDTKSLTVTRKSYSKANVLTGVLKYLVLRFELLSFTIVLRTEGVAKQ